MISGSYLHTSLRFLVSISFYRTEGFCQQTTHILADTASHRFKRTTTTVKALGVDCKKIIIDSQFTSTTYDNNDEIVSHGQSRLGIGLCSRQERYDHTSGLVLILEANLEDYKSVAVGMLQLLVHMVAIYEIR